MSALQIKPLVVAREHAVGLHSACLAFAPHIVAYGREQESAIDELTWFLADFFAELDADDVQKYVIPEPATTRSVKVVIPRGDVPKAERLRAHLEVHAVEVSMPDCAKWILIPSLGHATYISPADAQSLEAIVIQEVERLAAASDLDGTAYLDLLPPLKFELTRPLVKFEPGRGKDNVGRSPRQKRERAAEKLLAKVARPLEPSRDEVLHRELRELRELVHGPRASSLVLVGPEGCGKSAWLRAALAGPGGRRVFATSGAELVAGQSGLGQLQGHVQEVVEAVELLNATLYFESLEDLFAGRAGGHEDVASHLAPWIEQGRLRIVGELTPEAYDRLQHQRVGLFSYLHRFSVEPLGREQTLAILQSRGHAAQRRGRPGPDPGACHRILDLVERYEPYRVLPGKAIALLDTVITHVSAVHDAHGAAPITPDHVMRTFGVASGIPEFLLLDDRVMHVERVERFLRDHVIGQEHAVRRVAQTLCALKAGLQPSGKPLATLLFVGPTGVGKTELAKALARFLFGSTERMARFDMSEYADAYAADRLIRGSDRADGVLTRRVREQPFTVLLLDEIEKAHPNVFDLLLQVTGEGRLSDARGKVAYFHNTIVILTSNLGAQHRRSSLGFGKTDEDPSVYYEAQVRSHFRPEFVNRLDCIVSFASLGRSEIREVARASVQRIARRAGLEGRGIQLHVSSRALDELADAGFTPDYGARGLRRHLEQVVVSPLASLLSGIGDAADGAFVLVMHAQETSLPVELERDFLAEPSAREQSGQLVLQAFLRRKRAVREAPAGVASISRLRREMRKLRALTPIAEARDRLDELTIQLNEAARARRKAPGHDQIGALAERRARLAELLEPLDTTVREIEDLEELLISALQEPVLPKLEPDAVAAHARFREALLTALAVISEENELTFCVHELDDRRVLHELLLPLLAFGESQGWTTTLHVDRGERQPQDAWPAIVERRWGPPMAPALYRARHVDGPADRTFDAVLVRMRGAGAGAWLSFALGRFRYHEDGKCGELWVRHLCGRYDLREVDWRHPQMNPMIDRQVGKRQPVVLELTDGSVEPKGKVGELWYPSLKSSQVFDRWSEIVFDRAIAQVQRGEHFVPADLIDDDQD